MNSPEILIPSNKKFIILDATLLSALMSCARYLDLRYNHCLQARGGKSNSLEVGTLVHKVLEVYYQHLINGYPKSTAIGQALVAGQLFVTGCPHCADVIEMEKDVNGKYIPLPCKHQPGEYPGLINTPEENDDRKKIGWKWALATCEQYFDYYKNDSWVPLFTETVKGEQIYEDDELCVLWKAKIDLGVDTNNGIFPTDHKTMKQRRDIVSLNNQFMGQCVVMKVRNVVINKIGFQTSLEPKEKFTRELVSYSSDRLVEWASEIVPYYAYKLIQYSENEYYPPDFTHCENKYGVCMFKRVCESDRHMREEELRINFLKGPVWNPTNLVENDGD